MKIAVVMFLFVAMIVGGGLIGYFSATLIRGAEGLVIAFLLGAVWGWLSGLTLMEVLR